MAVLHVPLRAETVASSEIISISFLVAVVMASGFRASWRTVRTKLEKAGAVGPRLTLKGLRHTVATILAEMGFDDRTIADMLSQKTEAMARHYSKRANKTRKLSAVVKDFDAEVNRRRTQNVKPA
ncbi:tyrosine-type recombinase/integrase [Mesorhizobium sp. KR9-304]|uniref:tyrosine-type recombinase/integrase n=1 Tax=Mesorhizobium sp. KR9-304 TaxID=3156614 RepID=UPI0032B38B7F